MQRIPTALDRGHTGALHANAIAPSPADAKRFGAAGAFL